MPVLLMQFYLQSHHHHASSLISLYLLAVMKFPNEALYGDMKQQIFCHANFEDEECSCSAWMMQRKHN